MIIRGSGKDWAKAPQGFPARNKNPGGGKASCEGGLGAEPVSFAAWGNASSEDGVRENWLSKLDSDEPVRGSGGRE